APLSLFGVVVWASQPLGHWSTLPMNAHLISAPFRVWRVWNPQNERQNPFSLMSEEVTNRYTPSGSVGSTPFARWLAMAAVILLLLSLMPCEPVSKICFTNCRLPLTLPVLSP